MVRAGPLPPACAKREAAGRQPLPGTERGEIPPGPFARREGVRGVRLRGSSPANSIRAVKRQM